MIADHPAAGKALQVLVLGAGSMQRARWLLDLGHEPCWLGSDGWDPVAATASFESGDRRRWLAEQLDGGERFAAAVICADPNFSLGLAGRCIDAGIKAVLVDPPLPPSHLKLDQLRERSGNTVIMVGCNLRFSLKLPRFHWSLLELFSARLRPRWRHRVSMMLAGASPMFDNLYDEIDLAYSVNGSIQRIATMRRNHFVRVGIEHTNSSYTELCIDRSGASSSITATVTAYDDGTALHVLHEPMQLQAMRGAESAQVAELKHFLDCVAAGRTPCSTLADATHVQNWTVAISKAFHPSS